MSGERLKGEKLLDAVIAKVRTEPANPPPLPPPPELPPKPYALEMRVRCLAGPPSRWTGGHRGLAREGVIVGWRPPGLEVRYDGDSAPTWLHPTRVSPLDVWGNPVEGFNGHAWERGMAPPIALDQKAWEQQQAPGATVGRVEGSAPYPGLFVR